jgi:cell division protein FtsN
MGSRPNAYRRDGPRGVSLPVAISAALVAGGVAYYLGDSAGYARGLGQAQPDGPRDPLARLDARAALHQKRAESLRPRDAGAAAEGPDHAGPEPVALNFHDDLKGGPRPPPEKPLVAPPAPAPPVPRPEPRAEPRPESTTGDAPRQEDKPAPAVVPAAAHHAPATNGLTLQAGPFLDKEQALVLFGRLQKAGMKPIIVPEQASGALRIRVGRFSDRAEAEHAAKALQARDGLSTSVVQH